MKDFSRKGDLITHIRIALLSLDRDPYVDLRNKPIIELQAMLKALRDKQRAAGIIKASA